MMQHDYLNICVLFVSPCDIIICMYLYIQLINVHMQVYDVSIQNKNLNMLDVFVNMRYFYIKLRLIFYDMWYTCKYAKLQLINVYMQDSWVYMHHNNCKHIKVILNLKKKYKQTNNEHIWLQHDRYNYLCRHPRWICRHATY